MKIAIDIDGVLADLMPTLNTFYNQRFGTSFRVEDYRYHDLEKTWGCSREDAVRIVEEFFQCSEFLGIRPIPGAVEGVATSARNHELFSITSRPENIRDITEEFIRRNFGDNIRKVIHTGHYTLSASRLDKGSVCLSEGADLLIEDCLETALDATKHDGLSVFLLNQPWNKPNKTYLSIPNRFYRIMGGWPEIMRRLN